LQKALRGRNKESHRRREMKSILKSIARKIIFVFIVTALFFTGCDSEVAVPDILPVDSTVAAEDHDISLPAGAESVYLIGAGMHDITGPPAECGMMGFAVDTQKTSGIHMRLRSRAFIVGDADKRVVFLSIDTQMCSQMMKVYLGRKIAEDPVLSKYYSIKNICISATHTHSGPGGYSGYFLYDFTIGGFIEQNFNAIVDGMFNSIAKAHNNLEQGNVFINTGTLSETGWQRSSFAYENNPTAEKELYGSDTDKSFTLLKLVNLNGDEIGMINWFAVHTTNIGPTNTLISGDNKGYASYLFEKDKDVNYLSDKTFVAAFAQANSGDVSPNVPFGPAMGEHDYENMELLARRQYDKAVELYDSATQKLSGNIDFRHEWVDMRTLVVEEENCTTCAAGMGASFSSGSPADNPSPAALFPPGTTVDSLNWNENAKETFLDGLLGGVIGLIWSESSSPEYEACHYPKPVLIPTGAMAINFSNIPATPQIMPVQVFKIGNLAIAAQPTEVTTMAGRRVKKTLLDSLGAAGVNYSVIAGLSNSYASYMATKEEYAMQSYAAACTQFGPNQCKAFRQEFRRLCQAMIDGSDVPSGPEPFDVIPHTVNFNIGVVLDDAPIGKWYGDIETDAMSSYSKGEKVAVVFWGGQPNNNLKIQKSYLVVEKQNPETGDFEPVAYDWDNSTGYHWKRDGVSYSKVTVTWDTSGIENGTYRIRHSGHRKSGWTRKIYSYEGSSKTFLIQ